MASIGPSLPPHLLKRKRTPEPESRASSNRPSKAGKTSANNDEIDLGEDASSDEDEFGPSSARLPPSVPNTSRIGPSLPSSTPSRIIGPAPPPADIASRPTTDPDPDSGSGSDSDDDDDDYGPALPPPSQHTASQVASSPTDPYEASASRRDKEASSAPKRDEWMLAPPTDNTRRAPADPSSLQRARKFALGTPLGDGKVSTLWTETAEEKARRLADAVLGRGQQQQGQPPQQREEQSAAGPRASERNIQCYTESTRGESLYEEHRKKRKEGRAGDGTRRGKNGEEEDDPSQRPFDKEKDMAVSQKISDTQRRDMLKQAADFGGRFQKGKYL